MQPFLMSVSDPMHFSKITMPGPPPLSFTNKQRSPPSELQNFVRQATGDILGDFKPYVPPPDPEEEDEESIEAINEQRLAELVNVGRINRQTNKPTAPSRRRIRSGLRLRHETDVLILESGGDLENNIGNSTDRYAIFYP